MAISKCKSTHVVEGGNEHRRAASVSRAPSRQLLAASIYLLLRTDGARPPWAQRVPHSRRAHVTAQQQRPRPALGTSRFMRLACTTVLLQQQAQTAGGREMAIAVAGASAAYCWRRGRRDDMACAIFGRRSQPASAALARGASHSALAAVPMVFRLEG